EREAAAWPRLPGHSSRTRPRRVPERELVAAARQERIAHPAAGVAAEAVGHVVADLAAPARELGEVGARVHVDPPGVELVRRKASLREPLPELAVAPHAREQ